MLNDYEAKRKQQNREAQRRYRNRCKEGSSRRAQQVEQPPQPSGLTPSATSWATTSPMMSPPSHTALTYASPSLADLEFPTHGARGGRALAAAPFLDTNSVSGFDDYLSNDFSYFGADITESTFSPHSTTSYHTPSALPSTNSNDSWTTTSTATTSTGHNSPHLGIASNLCAKAEGLIDELERLYEFGVDMEIISPRGALAENLTETRGLFREVACVGGKRRR